MQEALEEQHRTDLERSFEYAKRNLDVGRGGGATGAGVERTLQVQLEIPEDLARQLATDAGGVTRAALEAVALESIRSGKLTVSQARRLLGIESRYGMDGVGNQTPGLG